ncbi:MAG: hypothetical protein ACYC09_00205 [Bacteroidota bacterium]
MKYKSKLGLSIIILSIIIIVFSTSFSQSQPKRYIVKLYSGNTMVATWTALDWGSADGQTLVFTVGERHNPMRVRINGTYSIEEFQ